jgi:hypothetical protein
LTIWCVDTVSTILEIFTEWRLTQLSAGKTHPLRSSAITTSRTRWYGDRNNRMAWHPYHGSWPWIHAAITFWLLLWRVGHGNFVTDAITSRK